MQEEISKHTKKAYKAMKSEHSLGDKLKEIAIEIGIIVFAVSLSIWLHGWSEHRHQQAEVKEFLIDLKEDLKTDLKNIETIQKNQIENHKGIKFALNLTRFQLDSLKRVKGSVNFNSNFITTKFNIGNYEGFKSSGKIGYIENKKIKKLMFNYYQDTVPNINDFERLNNEQILSIFDYIGDNADQKTADFFLDKKFKQKFKFFENTFSGNLDGYRQVIKEIKELIKEIDKVN
jgi:ribosomal protein L32E